MDLDQGGNQQPWTQNSSQGPTLGNVRTSAGRRFLLAPLTLYIYNANLNGVIWTNTSGNVNWLPGNAAGAAGTGGQYS